jgi:hypothetical protein
MSTEPEGKVFYGLALVDEHGDGVEPEGPWDSLRYDWEKFYIERKGGLPEPGGTSCRTPEWDKWRADRRALLEAGGVDVEMAGYEDNLISLIVIRESYIRAEWSEIKPLKSLEAKPEWDQKLHDWCELMGVEWREPGWYVASLYF